MVCLMVMGVDLRLKKLIEIINRQDLVVGADGIIRWRSSMAAGNYELLIGKSIEEFLPEDDIKPQQKQRRIVL